MASYICSARVKPGEGEVAHESKMWSRMDPNLRDGHHYICTGLCLQKAIIILCVLDRVCLIAGLGLSLDCHETASWVGLLLSQYM